MLSQGLRIAVAAALLAFAGVAASAPAAAQTPQQQPPAPAQQQQQQPETPPADQAPAETPAIDPIAVPERTAIVVRGQSKWDEGFSSITAAFSRLRAEADAAKLKPTGNPLAVFVQSDDEGFTFEAMLPVEIDPATPPKLAEGVSAGRSPGGQALKFEHRGAYDDIESTYEAIAAYLDEKGLAARDELIEEFVLEKPSSDDADLSVDIYVLLKQ